MRCELNLCAKEFTPSKHWQKFCSKTCRESYWNIRNPVRRAEEGTFDERRCEVCNKRFIPALKTQKYDRADCRWIAYNNRKAAKTPKKNKINRMGRPGPRPHMQKLDRTIYS